MEEQLALVDTPVSPTANTTRNACLVLVVVEAQARATREVSQQELLLVDRIRLSRQEETGLQVQAEPRDTGIVASHLVLGQARLLLASR